MRHGVPAEEVAECTSLDLGPSVPGVSRTRSRRVAWPGSTRSLQGVVGALLRHGPAGFLGGLLGADGGPLRAGRRLGRRRADHRHG
eukprot:4729508-Lingulodinium_polyedra.AAC.1